MPWEETQDFIRSGHRDPDEFEPNSLRTITLSEEEGIKAVIGKPKGQNTTEVQSYIFSKEKGWTLEKAKQWFREHQEKAKESFSWAGSIKEVYGTSNLIRGKALHPLRTVHPEEWPEVREYLEEELQKAAHSLKGNPLILDHYKPIRGKVLGAEYEDGAIEYVAQLNDPRIMSQIGSGDIKHCSVEFEWKSLENVDGVAPRGIVFTGLSLLKDFEPGDPLTTVEVWEAVIKQLKEAKGAKEQAKPQEFIWSMVRDPAGFLEERFSTVWVDQTNGIQGIYGYLREQPDSPQPMALLFMKANGWTIEKMQEWLRDHPQYVRQVQPQPAPAAIGIQPAQPGPSQTQGVMKMSRNPIWERVWTRNYVNNLPDAAFAIILPGGEKDETGKTVPRTLRKFPHHNAQGRIDLPHLRNANARVPQSDLTAEQKAEAQHHLDRHKKAAGIGEVAEEAKVPFKHGWPVLKEQAEEPEEVEEVEFEFVGQDVPEWADSLISTIEDAIGEINDNFDALVIRVEALEKGPSEEIIEAIRKKLRGISAGGKGKGLGEAIIEPGAPSEPSDLISKREVLAHIPDKRVWRSWSLGPQRLVQELKRKLQSS